MTTWTVTTNGELEDALDLAELAGGGIIELSGAGATALFEETRISDYVFGSGLTIRSATGKEGIFDDLVVEDCEGVTFDNVTFFHVPPDQLHLFENAGTFARCDGLTIENCRVSSSQDDNYDNDGDGLQIIDSQNVSVIGNDITDVRKGLIVTNTDNLLVNGNQIHHLGGDAMNFVNIRDAEISENIGYDFDATDDFHNDFIQFFANPSDAATDTVEISGNVVLAAGQAVQGIFVDSDYAQAFYNLTITENLIVTAAINGIKVEPGINLIISNNTVLGTRGDPNAGKILVESESGIDSDYVTVTDNISTGISLVSVTHQTVSGNVQLQFVSDDLSNYTGNLFIDPLAGTNINDLLPRLSATILSGVGASDPYALVTAPVAYFTHTQGTTPDQTLASTFVAVDWDSSVPGGTTYSWDFGDGVTAEGATVTHRFGTPGDHTVELTVYTPGSGTEILDQTIVVQHPTLLSLDFETDEAISNGSSSSVDDTSPFDRAPNWVSGSPPSNDSGADSYVSGPSGGSAANFNAGTSAILVPATGDFENLRALTISFDMNADTSLAKTRMIWKSGVFGVEMNAAGKLYAYVWTEDGQEDINTGSFTLADDVWARVTVTFDGNASPGAGTLKIYVDGVEKASGTVGQQLATSVNTLRIGSGNNADYFDGAIDNVRIFQGAFTPTQVATLETYLANTMPTDIALSGDGVYERSAASTVVGLLSTTDGGDTATYTLAPGSSSNFAISGSNLVVASGASLDYETATSHSVTVRATDSAGNTREETLTVQVKDALEFPASGGGTITGTGGADMVIGGTGIDQFNTGSGADTFNGGAGDDVVIYSQSTSGVGVDLATPGAGYGDGLNDVYIDIWRLVGTNFADTLSGDSNANRLEGDSGADIVNGRGGADRVYGGGGTDTINGGAGADFIQGSSGNDLFVFVLGEAQGDEISDFAGNGASAGDQIELQGYGVGASLSNVGDDWTVTWSGGTETFKITGVTTLHASDVIFT